MLDEYKLPLPSFLNSYLDVVEVVPESSAFISDKWKNPSASSFAAIKQL